jgi:hypothetical protein
VGTGSLQDDEYIELEEDETDEEDVAEEEEEEEEEEDGEVLFTVVLPTDNELRLVMSDIVLLCGALLLKLIEAVDVSLVDSIFFLAVSL